MAVGIGVDLVVVQAGSLGSTLVDTGGSHSHVEDLQDSGTQGILIGSGNAADVIGSNTALLVGGTSQRDISLFAGDKVGYFHSVAYGIDIRIRW